jgi:hypothetical protein
MNITDIYLIKAIGIMIIAIVVFTMYRDMYIGLHDNEYYKSMLPNASSVDIFKIDMTRSENGVPIIEGIIAT